MAVTYGRARLQTLRLLDEYNTSGAVQTTQDVVIKIAPLINEALDELAATTAKIAAVFYVVHNPVYNELGRDTSSVKNHLPGVDFSAELTGAKSCFFEATGPATIHIEEEIDSVWTVLETIAIESTVTDFTEYRRLITASDASNKIRLRFSGDYIYRYRNYILYPYTWPTADDVQQHRPYFLYSFPDNYLDFDKVMVRRDVRQYVPLPDYVLRPDKKIGINRFYAPAEVMVHYWRQPTKLDTEGAVTDDDTLDIADEAALTIPYYAAGHIKLSEGDSSSGLTLINMYEVKKANLVGNTSDYSSSIINVTGW